jgi:hypothetical protein
MANGKATLAGGQLIEIENCFIEIPPFGKIKMKALPEISDSKSASYNDESIMGRSFPLKTYSHSENRAITMTVHFYTIQKKDIEENLNSMRALESAVYPREQNGMPFVPPPVCKIKCGKLLADETLCVILKSYSVKFPTDVVWDEDTYMPYKFDVETNWEVVYKSDDLPGQQKIIDTGGSTGRSSASTPPPAPPPPPTPNQGPPPTPADKWAGPG